MCYGLSGHERGLRRKGRLKRGEIQETDSTAYLNYIQKGVLVGMKGWLGGCYA